jgi:hypothetical protein
MLKDGKSEAGLLYGAWGKEKKGKKKRMIELQ